jgi:hypothetical protein
LSLLYVKYNIRIFQCDTDLTPPLLKVAPLTLLHIIDDIFDSIKEFGSGCGGVAWSEIMKSVETFCGILQGEAPPASAESNFPNSLHYVSSLDTIEVKF